MSEESTYILSSKNWIKEVVVGQNFCPFAGAVFVNDTIRYRIDDGQDVRRLLLEELQFLEENPACETTLIIYPEGLSDWSDYLDWLDFAQEILFENEFEGVYQIASFHPEYQFEGADVDDPANYTNRSPYPMLHLLREESIDRVVEGAIDTEAIPVENEKRARELGIAAMQELLKKSFL